MVSTRATPCLAISVSSAISSAGGIVPALENFDENVSVSRNTTLIVSSRDTKYIPVC